MKRRITLYIGGRKADISDQSFFLLNYQAEDLQNPTIVKNSYSQQITLPGTCRNNRIFGSIGRADRVSGSGGATGAAFNASKRTSFALYGEDGAVLESGYLKLDEVDAFHRQALYLYGGLFGLRSIMFQQPRIRVSAKHLTYCRDRPVLC